MVLMIVTRHVFAAARRHLGALVLIIAALAPVARAQAFDARPLAQAVLAEEARLDARLGAALIDTADGATWSHRGDERFPLNSTHKAFTCAALLKLVDDGRLGLDAMVSVPSASLVPHSPFMERHVAPERVSLGQACAAAITVSDNTAANIATAAIGGPDAFTAFMRGLGDAVTRLDRLEPEMNEATPGDARDTTTPRAIAASLRGVALGDALGEASRARLVDWMAQDKLADALLRAALPPSWTIADKTGAGGHGSRSIIAILWPAARPPVVVAIFITQTSATLAERDAAIARIGRVLVAMIER